MSPRRYALKSWLIRALIPDDTIGTYVLWSPSVPVYVGRSDTSLRRRLLEHARSWPDVHFTYDVAISVDAAFAMECSLFHALGEHTVNLNHPQRPSVHHPDCLFCIETFQYIAARRLVEGRITA